MAEPITLDEAKQHLRVVGADEDALITRLIVAARQMVEQRTQRAIVVRTQSVAFDTFPQVAELPWPPFVSITQIGYVDLGGVWQTVPLTNYNINTYVEPARMVMASGITWPQHAQQEAAVVISYEAGYAVPAGIPVPLIQWMLLAIGAMYEHREQIVAGVTVESLPEDFMGLLWQPYMVYM